MTGTWEYLILVKCLPTGTSEIDLQGDWRGGRRFKGNEAHADRRVDEEKIEPEMKKVEVEEINKIEAEVGKTRREMKEMRKSEAA